MKGLLAPQFAEVMILSNRLPVRRVRHGRAANWETSPGGLVSALRPLVAGRSCHWIGWTGVSDDDVKPFVHDGIVNHSIVLSRSEVRSFYDGFCNRTLWPLYHDAIRTPQFSSQWWQSYVEVNRRFAKAALRLARPDTLIWVHDYHLQLVPAMVRDANPSLHIGFFLHIPFPPQELFAQIPWRRELIEGMAGSDVIGFQTRVGAQNFSQVARRYAGFEGQGDHLVVDGRRVQVSSFPISIDVGQFRQLARDPKVRRRAQTIREDIGMGRRILLGVDRLDYSKGIDVRLRAFEKALSDRRVRADACVLLQIAVPCREQVAAYRQERVIVERLVGEVNGRFGELGRMPVHYLYRSLDIRELVALYQAADVMLVTPLRDGMNLVAKEFVVSRAGGLGVLVLSEFTGAARELDEAVLVNPHDLDGMAMAIQEALAMTEAQQRWRMARMQRRVRRHDVFRWAGEFSEAMTKVRGHQGAAMEAVPA